MISRVVKSKVEEILGRCVTNDEIKKASEAVENIGFKVNDNSPDAVIKAVARKVEEATVYARVSI